MLTFVKIVFIYLIFQFYAVHARYFVVPLTLLLKVKTYIFIIICYRRRAIKHLSIPHESLMRYASTEDASLQTFFEIFVKNCLFEVQNESLKT